MAINAYNNLQGTQQAQGKSLERLSSGFRINRAADDAAGLVISESLRSQVGGFKVAKRNAQDAVSLVQTAEGALTEVHSMLQRMRDLSTQSANDTNNAKGRKAINSEISELSTQIKNVLSGTEFNGKQLFVKNGQGAKSNPVTATASANINTAAGQASLSTGKDGRYVLTTQGNLNNLTDAANNVAAPTVAAIDTATSNATAAISELEEKYGITIAGKINNGDAPDTNADIKTGDYYIVEKAAGGATGYNLMKAGADLTQAGDAVNGGALSTAQANFIEAAKTHNNAAGSFNYDAAIDDAPASAPTEALNFQVGANNKGTDLLTIATDKVNLFDSVYDKLGEIDVKSNGAARASIDKIDAMIDSVSSVRGTLGATQNRLDHTINSIKVSVENLTASESRIRDTDMAEEMMSLSRAQILNQAGTSMLAQANQVPQGVLSLLR